MLRLINLSLFAHALLSEEITARRDSKSYSALRFAYDESSYILFTPKMDKLTDKFSVCLWIKKLQAGNIQCPFGYGSEYEIFMTDNGYYNRVFGSSVLDRALTSKFTTPTGSWFPYCSTWSFGSRTYKVYVNGLLAGTETTPSGRKLKTGQKLVLGNMYSGSGHRFGGEMFGFNVFDKVLTALEVATMAARGFCADIPEELQMHRVVKWEEIVKLIRCGTVEDFVDPQCAEAAVVRVGELLSQLEDVENRAMTNQRKLQTAVSEKNSLEISYNLSHAELLKVQELFNSTQEDLKEVRIELGATREKLTETTTDLEDTQAELEDTQYELRNVTESKCPLHKGKLTKWDIFYSPSYYNKTFTRRLYQQLRTTWDSVSSEI